ncbi:MAG TPA: FmdB family zinc ribbon protein [Pyrinomonadaceae bacterium]|jgi:putative FmdB family regulatory protein|nr:FmdB family zinc ribbon protein [Pyrinomonadaceae bacterium]
MPIYEYKCLNCENHLEIMQKISDEPLTECPNCNGKLEKQWSRTGFQFKGTGWYVTDYAGKGAEAKTEAKAETAPATTDAPKTSSSAESTTAANTASKPETKATKVD